MPSRAVVSRLCVIAMLLSLFGANPVASAQQTCGSKAIPGRIEAECFDASSSIQTEPTLDEGGGLNVGYIIPGSKVDYNVTVARAATYTISLRIAAPSGVPGAVQLLSGSTVLVTFDIPQTGGFQSWATTSRNVPLQAGAQTLRLQAVVGGWNINWLEFQDWPWLNTTQSPDARADLVLGQMTFDEKIAFLTPQGSAGNRYSRAPIPRLGIPPAQAADGCCGVRANLPSTQLPVGMNLASTFSEQAARRYGQVLGRETWLLGYNTILGPTLDLARLPNYGRISEGFGEDPLLSGRVGAGQILGEQDSPVIGMPKHYNLNNQETRRGSVDERVDERTLQEIYTLPWEIAIKTAQPGGVLCAFNGVNGEFSCGSRRLLTDILKNQLGHKGFVQSDFNAARSLEDFNAGLDFEDPDPVQVGQNGANLRAAVLSGQIPPSRLNDMVRRILRSYFAQKLFENPPPALFTNPEARIPIPENEVTAHDQEARSLAAQGIVLLKNANNALPLQDSALSSIAVIGSDADWNIQGGGSPFIPNPTRVTTILDGIRERAGSGVEVTYSSGTDPVSYADMIAGPAPVPSSVLTPAGDTTGAGLRAEYWQGLSIEGTPFLARTDRQVNLRNGIGALVNSSQVPPLPYPLVIAPISARWTGTLTPPVSGSYTLSLSHLGRARLFVDNNLLIDDPGTTYTTQSVPVTLQAGQAYDVRIEYFTDAPDQFDGGLNDAPLAQVRFGWTPPANGLSPAIQQAVQQAARADVAVVVARDYAAEGADRGDLTLPQDQDRLIRAVAAANPRTVVVLATSGPVLMPWLSELPAVLEAWYPGQQQGRAVADVLFGDVNPSGKLPVTFPLSHERQPIRSTEQWPGAPASDPFVFSPQYTEGIFVGYRGYDQLDLEPLFPFGHGLSYTQFAYSNLRVTNQSNGQSDLAVSFTIRNTGTLTGTEVPQVYIGPPNALPEGLPFAKRSLAAFQPVTLAPGQSQEITLPVDDRQRSYWSVAENQWVVVDSPRPIFVGASSRDIRLQATVNQAPSVFSTYLPILSK